MWNVYVIWLWKHQTLSLSNFSPTGRKLWTRSTTSFDAYSIDYPSSLGIAPNGNVIVTGSAGGWFETGCTTPTAMSLWSQSVQGGSGAKDLAIWPK